MVFKTIIHTISFYKNLVNIKSKKQTTNLSNKKLKRLKTDSHVSKYKIFLPYDKLRQTLQKCYDIIN